MILNSIFLIAMVVVLIAAAIYAVYQKDLLYAVLATGVISLILSIFFYILQAPDVALTEAAIGIALTTIVFIITIRNTSRYEEDKPLNKIDQDNSNPVEEEL
ncbi:MAG: hydrogenase subunit MbhD domain-containing protein [Bacteroidota bacterium]